MENMFDWVETFKSLATWIKGYEDKQPELINILKSIGVEKGLDDKDHKGNSIELLEIDPFSFLSLIMKYGHDKRTEIFKKLLKKTKIDAVAPKNYNGVPSTDPRKVWLFSYSYERNENDIKNLWKLFNLAYDNNIDDDIFIECLSIKGTGFTKITEVLFFYFPDRYYPIDKPTIPFLQKYGILVPKNNKMTTWVEYQECLRAIRKEFADKTFYQLSHDAYWYDYESDEDSNDEHIYNVVEPLNQILYGVAGTGKTRNTISRALSILGTELDLTDESSENFEKIKGEFDEWRNEGNIEFVTFHQSFSYEDFVEGIRAVTNKRTKQVEYETKSGVFKQICDNAREDEENNYVLIIDEINRGNISRIFGELITLIEESKREGGDETLSVTLPYSKESFSVPKNLYIIGTMNSSDRSLTGIDIALRRRFKFIEMMPRPELLEGLEIDSVNVEYLLETVNQRIEILLDRDHVIGHAYFMNLDDESSLDDLSDIFKRQIIPLLQEYFYDDWEKVDLVLNRNGMLQQTFFDADIESLFEISDIQKYGIYSNAWTLNNTSFDDENSYIKIYNG